ARNKYSLPNDWNSTINQSANGYKFAVHKCQQVYRPQVNNLTQPVFCVLIAPNKSFCWRDSFSEIWVHSPPSCALPKANSPPPESLGQHSKAELTDSHPSHAWAPLSNLALKRSLHI